MANTERFAVLVKVRESKQAVQRLLEDESVTGKDRQLLERLEAQLDSVEDDLIIGELTEQVGQLRQASSDLGKVVTQMKKAEKKIQKIVDGVDDAAKALKILADIAVKAAAIA